MTECTPRPISTKIRRACFDYWKREVFGRVVLECRMCGFLMDPVRDVWEADHELVRAHGNPDEPPNVRPLCKLCHLEKTKGDVKAIAKGKRGRDKHFGIKRSSKPMPHGRHSRTKRKLSGEVVPR